MYQYQIILIYILTMVTMKICDIGSLEARDPTRASTLNFTRDLQIILDNIGDGELKISNQWETCDKYRCFNSLNCELNDPKEISYYVYPPVKVVDNKGNLIYSSREMMTREFSQLLDTILSSSRNTLNPEKACIFVPRIDLSYLKTIEPAIIALIYDSLPFWTFADPLPGTNHMIINLDPTPDMTKITNSIGRAIHVSPCHNTWTLRPKFDQSVPVYLIDPTQTDYDHEQLESQTIRPWKLVFVQYDSVNRLHRRSIDGLKHQLGDSLVVLGHQCDISPGSKLSDDNFGECGPLHHLKSIDKIGCRCLSPTTTTISNHRGDFKYPQLFSKAQYCLILDTTNNNQVAVGDSTNYILIESIKRGCIPILPRDFILPFEELIPWSRLSIVLTNNEQLERLPALISDITRESRQQMSRLAKKVWSEHFSLAENIVEDLFKHYDSLVYPEMISRESSINARESQNIDL